MITEPVAENAGIALFDPNAFRKELAECSNVIGHYKSALTNIRKSLDQRFSNGDDIEGIIKAFTWCIDQILICAWEQQTWDPEVDICLLAVGGYGRGELHPYSDIDIQILVSTHDSETNKQSISAFLTFLWDISLQIGQSVRTIKENRKEAQNDITIITALTESRALTGSRDLFTELINCVSQDKIWKPEKFFAAKLQEQKNRHDKQDDIDYALEPNIKLAPGGMRDIQTVGWIAKRYYDVSNFYELVQKGFLDQHEYELLIQGRNFLWSIRYGLHMMAGRSEDRLLFDYQRQLAEMYNYPDDERSLGIEKLMQEYYRVIQNIRLLNDVLLQLFDEDIIRSREKTKITPINTRFQKNNRHIEAINDKVFTNTPSALLEIFVLMSQDNDIDGIRASTIRLITKSRHLIDSKFRDDITNRTLFMELLRSPYHVARHIRQMKRYGILGLYLPEFGRIVGQMQHDLFHIYTVDDHTLLVVELMRRLFMKQIDGNRFPLCSQVIEQLPKIELLYITGLYHDIAKGRGGDHSILGTEDAEDFCRRHYLGEWDTNLVSWLVRNHLIMSATAQREDLQDPETIRKFADLVGDKTRLDYLYTLTVCDINATNPNLWTSWRASLMRQLYNATLEVLREGPETFADKESWVKDNQQRALQMLTEEGLSEEKIRDLWQKPHEDYFLRESAEDIVWHTLSIYKYRIGDGPIILMRNIDEPGNEGATKIFIFAKKSQFLFSNIVTAFERLNLNIQDARIYNTQSEFCFNSFMVLEENGDLVNSEKSRLNQIRDMLTRYVKAEGLEQAEFCRLTRKQRYFTQRAQTRLHNDAAHPYTTLEVLCPDRPGLLSIIAATFVEMGIILHNAKITTLGENVEDVFFISDNQNQPLFDPVFIERLETKIRSRLDAESEQTESITA